MLYLFTLFITDYLLTYYGIRIGAIYEGNPLWVQHLNMPLYTGLPLRILFFIIIGYLPIVLAKKYKNKCRPIFIKAYYGILITANICVLCMHIRWMYMLNIA